MSEPGGWTTPDGWGPPTPPPAPPADAPPPAGTAPPYGYSTYGHRPDVKPGIVPLRPLGLGEMLDGAVGVIRRYPRPTLGLAAAVAVVATLANVLLLVTVFRPFVDLDSPTFEPGSTQAVEDALGGAAVGGLLTGVLTLLSTAVLTGILTAVVGRAVLGQPMDLRGAWAQVRPVLLRLIGVALLLAVVAGAVVFAALLVGVLLIAVGGALMALVGVPVILAGLAGATYLYIRLSLAPCALVLEKVGVRDSLRRSWLLVKGDWWRVFGITLLTLIVAMFVSLVIQVPFELFGYGSVSDLTSGGGDVLSTRTLIASSLGSIIAATLVDPFTAGVRALLYVDRRMRAEGLDVALTAAAAHQQP